MLVGSLTFLTPWAALAALFVVIPLAALLRSERNTERAASTLGLQPARRQLLLPAGLCVAVCALLAAGAAQPALRSAHRQSVRTSSEIVFVVDVSRSMLAAPSLSARTRIARAKAIVTALRSSVPDVPSGLSGLTDRVLPYIFPTADTSAFARTLAQSVAIEAPPPQGINLTATNFGPLTALAQDGFFDKSATARTCALVSDAETDSYSATDVGRALSGSGGCRLIVVRVGGAHEHVYGVNGQPEAGYVPSPAAAANAQELADAAQGRAFTEHQLGAAEAALRSDAEVGPERTAGVRPSTNALGAYVAAVAFLPALALGALRLTRRKGRA